MGATAKKKSLSIGWDWLHKSTIRPNGFHMLFNDAENVPGVTPPRPKTFRERVYNVVHSGKFQIAVIILIVLDALIVITELLFDLKVFEHPDSETSESTKHIYEKVAHALHYVSLSILGIFIVEIGFRVYAMRLQFFRHKLEVLDAVVVLVSFVLDIVFLDNKGLENGLGLLIVLRLWRVARIVNGIVMSVELQAEKKIEDEQQLREECEEELATLQKHCLDQDEEIHELQELLKAHGIDVPPKKHKPEEKTGEPSTAVVEGSVDGVHIELDTSGTAANFGGS